MPDALLTSLELSLALLAVRLMLALGRQQPTSQGHTAANAGSNTDDPPTALARLKFRYKRTIRSKSVGFDLDLRVALEWIAKLVRFLAGKE